MGTEGDDGGLVGMIMEYGINPPSITTTNVQQLQYGWIPFLHKQRNQTLEMRRHEDQTIIIK